MSNEEKLNKDWLEIFYPMFKSKTIIPTFDYVHIILALFIFEQNPEGIGRYRLQKELAIGSGTAKSLITKLNKKINFISVLDDNIRKGHILTEKGQKFLTKFKTKIPFIILGEIKVLKDLIIEDENTNVCICLVKNGAKNMSNGIAQRDAAIKVNGIGATCLMYDGTKFDFNLEYSTEEDKSQMKINERVQEYFKELIKKENSNLEANDVIILGLGKTPEISRLASLNAALTLI
jgi:predicted transcriptional regulator